MFVFRLIFSNLITRRMRTALTLAAIALAVSLVVAVTTGYRSVEQTLYDYFATYLGAVDAQVTQPSDPRKGVPEDVLARLRGDPDVRRAFGRFESDTGLLDKEGKPVSGSLAQLVGLDRPADHDILRTVINKGKWFDSDSGDVCVIDQQAAEKLKVDVGDTIFIPATDGKRALRLVGICHKPAFFAERAQWVYVPLKTAQLLTGRFGAVTRVMVELRRSDVEEAFLHRWKSEFKTRYPGLEVRLARENRQMLERRLDGSRFLNRLGGVVALVSATFIIFSTLMMGVTERQRTLAMLRAIGATRMQVARMVVAEGGMLALLGAMAGVPLGLLWAWALATLRPDVFSSGVTIDGSGIFMAIGGSLGSALLAAVLPAWSASRTSPLEAMTPLARAGGMWAPLLCGVGGLVLICIDSTLIYGMDLRFDLRFYLHFWIGLPALITGFFMLTPAIVVGLDKVVGLIASASASVQVALLRQQLGGGIWRAAGTGGALMLALAVLVVMQSVGTSMLNGWRLPTNFPDIFIYTSGQSLKQSQWSKLDNVEGIRKGQVIPLIIGTTALPKGTFSASSMSLLPDAVMFVGIPPELGMDMMDLEFIRGDRQSAIAAMKRPRHIAVTDEFRQLRNADVGSKVELLTRQGWREFTVCAVVRSPGIDVVVEMFDIKRLFDQRTATCVFGSLEDAKDELGIDEAWLFAAKLEGDLDRKEVIKRVRDQLGEFGWKAGDIRKIKNEIVSGFDRLLQLVSLIALAAMGVAALGVTNTIMASIRTRRWQFGILRSIGVTRGQLLRLVLSEAILLAAIGVILGLAAGLLMSFNALGMSRSYLGYSPPLAPPWGRITIGIVVTVAAALLASWWPARNVANSQPLELLQAGRAAS